MAAGVLATAAAAAPPTITKGGTFTGTSILTGVCRFPVDVTFSQTFTEIDYFDSSGNLTRVYIHVVEQDTSTRAASSSGSSCRAAACS